MRPRLRRGARLSYDGVRDRHVVLFPEGVLVLNDTAIAVLRICDGARDEAELAAILAAEFDGVEVADVTELLARLAARGVVELGD